MIESERPYNPPTVLSHGSSSAVRLAPGYRAALSEPPSEELSIDIRQMTQIILRRWRTAFAVGIVAGLCVVLYSLSLHPVYSATSMIVIEPKRQQLIRLPSDQDGGAPADSTIVDTKVTMATSLALAARVVTRENLQYDPEFGGSRQIAEDPNAQLERVAQSVSHHMTVRRVGLTWAIQFTFRSTDAKKAARIANAYAEEFIAWGVASKDSENEKVSQFINDHLNSLRQAAETAENAVQQYKIAHNLMGAEGRTMAEQEVGSLSVQIASAQAELAEKEARLRAADEQTRSSGSNQENGATLGSATVSQLRTQQAEASRHLAELKTRYGPRYPEVQKAEGDLADINSKIQDEANRIHSSLNADVSAAAQRLRSLRGSEDIAQGSLASNGRAEAGLIELERRADASRQLYDAFLSRSKETSVQGAEQPDATVYGHATTPTAPSSPNAKLIFILAFAVALSVAALTIVVLEFADTSIRNSEDVEKKFGLPLVGVLPVPASTGAPSRVASTMSPETYLVEKPFSLFSEAFRTLRAFIITPNQYGAPNKVVAIASSLPKEGKSTSAFSLMRSMAMSGTSVVLLDCDLRQRGVTSFVTSQNPVGIVEVLEGKATLVDALVYDQPSGGWVLPVIETQGHLIDLFSSPAMDVMLDELKQRFAVVLIDTPATLAVADARILCAKADAVLFLVHWAKTPAKAIAYGLEALTSAGANIIGLVLTRVDLKRQNRASYDGMGSYYGRQKGYYHN